MYLIRGCKDLAAVVEKKTTWRVEAVAGAGAVTTDEKLLNKTSYAGLQFRRGVEAEIPVFTFFPTL